MFEISYALGRIYMGDASERCIREKVFNEFGQWTKWSLECASHKNPSKADFKHFLNFSPFITRNMQLIFYTLPITNRCNRLLTIYSIFLVRHVKRVPR